ncbi:hypothetical protein [Legionella donaldsonii]|uniref:hypothetical protein n=1 Tax=Legionella donaldsonii TaxID=45060 RepID=UPI00399CB412
MHQEVDMVSKDKIVSLIAAIIKNPHKIESSVVKEKVSAFVKELYFECTKGKALSINISLSLHNTNSLIHYVSQLITYRAALGEVGAQQKLFNEIYEQFIDRSEFFKKGLQKGNPFVLRAYLVHIHHLAKKDGLSEKQKLALVSLLENSQHYIEAMDSTSCGRFKLLIDGYAKYQTAFLLNSLAPKDKTGILVDNVSKLYFSALKSLEMVSLGSDNSIALYADEEMYPEFPFADSSELIDTIRSEIQEIPVNTLR